MNRISFLSRRKTLGAAIIEFAIVSVVFFMLLIGIMEMGRVMFYWNTATELTRMGARMAVVCDRNDPDIAKKIADFYPLIPQNKVLVSYETIDGLVYVTVKVAAGVPVVTYIPFVPLNLSLPEFSTTLTGESLRSMDGGVPNPVCE